MIHRRSLLRTAVTALVICIVLAAIYALWMRYQVEPLTRDGKVRADLVPVAADVSGLVTEVRIRDDEFVRKGQILLVIDRPRYQLALDQADANLATQRVSLAQAAREDRRNRSMTELLAAEVIEQGRARVDALRTGLDQAIAARNLARLNLDRTYVRAPVDGTVSNMTLQPGVAGGQMRIRSMRKASISPRCASSMRGR